MSKPKTEFDIGDTVYRINKLQDEIKRFKLDCEKCKGRGWIPNPHPVNLGAMTFCPCEYVYQQGKYEVSEEFKVVRINYVKNNSTSIRTDRITYFIRRKGAPNILRMMEADLWTKESAEEEVKHRNSYTPVSGNVIASTRGCNHNFVPRPSKSGTWCTKCGEIK